MCVFVLFSDEFARLSMLVGLALGGRAKRHCATSGEGVRLSLDFATLPLGIGQSPPAPFFGVGAPHRGMPFCRFAFWGSVDSRFRPANCPGAEPNLVHDF